MSGSVLGSLNLQQLCEAGTGNKLIHSFKKSLLRIFYVPSVILSPGNKKMSKVQGFPTKMHTLTMKDQCKRYHRKAQSTSTAPNPVWRDRAGGGGNGNSSKSGYSVALFTSSPPAPSISCISGWLNTLSKVALNLCFKVRAILDTIFRKTDFERGAETREGMSLFPWTCSLAL